jgi:hypothetical protein
MDPTRRAPWLARAALLGVCLFPAWGMWLAQGSPMEEGFMLVFPEMVLDGKVPNRDFLHLYGPGSLWVLAAVFAVFGVSLAAERTVGFLQHVSLAFGVHGLLRPWGSWVSLGGATITAVIILTPSGLTALAWVGGLALAVWALRCGLDAAAADEGSRWRLSLAAGLLAGAALLYRADLVIAIALGGVTVTMALDRVARRRAALGLALGLSPYLVQLATAGPGNVMRGMLIEPVFDLRGGRRLPLPPSTDAYDGFLQGAAELRSFHWPLPSPSGPVQLLVWLVLLLVVDAGLVLIGVRTLRRHGDRRLLAIALFCVGLLPQALQRCDATHLAWVSAVPFGVVPAAIAELLRAPVASRTRTRVRRDLLAVGVPAVALLVLVPFFTVRNYVDLTSQTFGQRRQDGVIRNGDRFFPYNRSDAVVAANAMLEEADRISEPGDRLFVGTTDLRKTPYSEAFLYHLLPDLEPGTRYVEMDPGVANAPGSGLAEDLASSDIVILSSLFDDWVEPNDSRLLGPDEPNQVLARDFCLVESYGSGLFGHGLYELYERC